MFLWEQTDSSVLTGESHYNTYIIIMSILSFYTEYDTEKPCCKMQQGFDLHQITVRRFKERRVFHIM